MKRFFLSLCFVTFLSAGLVSCSDDAAEVTPINPDVSAQLNMTGNDPIGTGNKPTRP